MNFERKKIYRFGIVKAESPTSLPEFSPRYKSPAVSGDHLLKSGIRDFNDYLIKNPHNYPTTKTIHCFIVDDDGNYQYYAEGNPFDIAPQKANLADDDKTRMKSQGNATVSVKDNSEIVKELRNQVLHWRDVSEDYRKESDALRDEVQLLKEKIIKFDGEKLRWKIEKEQLESIIKDYNEKFKGMTGSSGFADKFKASIADQAGPILSGLANNPQLADMIVNIAQKIPYLRDMMTPPVAPSTPFADTINNDGVDTREGEFDVNS